MSYTGQPVSSTTYQVGTGKISDGKSIDVTVPQSTELKAGEFTLLDGFFGVSPISVTNGAGETQVIALQIDQVEYETDQITTSQTFAKGTKVYWDDATNKFTETATDNRLVGVVTSAKDGNNVIGFLLGPQI